VAGDTASATRRWLRTSLCEYVIRERLDAAMLLVEEIVASSVRRTLANQPITVLLTLEAQLCGLTSSTPRVDRHRRRRCEAPSED
jgi:hypothetical protein